MLLEQDKNKINKNNTNKLMILKFNIVGAMSYSPLWKLYYQYNIFFEKLTFLDLHS